MKLRNLILKGLLCLLAVPAMTSGAAARDKAEEGKDHHGKEHDIVREALRRGEVLPLAKILAIAAAARARGCHRGRAGKRPQAGAGL